MAALSVAVVLATTACSTADDEPEADGTTSTIKIGLIQPLTGNYAPYGISSARGVKLAVQEINDAGGITVADQKYTLEIVETDTRSDPTQAVAATTSMIRDQGIKLIFGSVAATENSAQLPVVANASSPPLFFPSATLIGPKLTAEAVKGEYQTVFTAAPLQATGMQTFVKAIRQEWPDVTKVYAIGLDDVAHRAAQGTWTAAAKSDGMDLVGEVLVPPDLTDFSTILNKVRSSGATAIEAYVAPDQLLNLGRQNEQLGAANRFIAPLTSSLIPEQTASGGAPLKTQWLTNNFGVSMAYPPSEPGKAFVEAYKTAYGEITATDDASGLAAPYADSVHLAAKAMQEAGTVTDMRKVAASLEKAVYDDGPDGTVRYNANHIIQVPVSSCLVVAERTTCTLVNPTD